MLYGVERSTDYYVVLSQSTRLTDRRTDVDSKTVRMHSQSHGNKRIRDETSNELIKSGNVRKIREISAKRQNSESYPYTVGTHHQDNVELMAPETTATQTAMTDNSQLITIKPIAFTVKTKYQIISISLQHKCNVMSCLLYTSPSPRDGLLSRMPSSA